MTACEAIKPTIAHVQLTELNTTGALFEAQINPQNSAATYEFVIVQQLRNPENQSDHGEPAPEDLRAVGGPIPAGAGNVTVSGLVTGLERGYTYWYEVEASNLAGKTRSEGDNAFSYFYAGGFPNGLLPGAPFRSVPPSPCALELVQQEAVRITARTEAERRQAKEQAEQKQAAEAAARYAIEEAEVKQAEEREVKEAAARKATQHLACIVPALKGETLTAARRSLRRAHCRLGEVRKSSHDRGKLIVVGQNHQNREKLAGGTAITVIMGTARSGRHRIG
jgi:hypothetical protein